MITVEEAITIQHHSSGFLLQHRALLGNGDRITFPHGPDEVSQFALAMAATPVYTWASPIKRMVDLSCADYPLHEAIGAIHYFHRPAMLWMFDEPVLWIVPPKSPRLDGVGDQPQPVDAILMFPWQKGNKIDLPAFVRDFWKGFTATPEERAVHAEAVARRLTGIHVTALSSLRTGQAVPLPIGTLPAGSRVMVPVMQTNLTFGCAASVDEGEIITEQRDDPTLRAEQTRLRQWVLAATALLKQRILVPQSQLASRGERKRLDRQDLPTSVMTITLRETAQQPVVSQGDVVDWSHRWIVRGHWRQQWYPSQDEHRIVWVPAYIKGPADRPLVVRPAVYAVTR